MCLSPQSLELYGRVLEHCLAHSHCRHGGQHLISVPQWHFPAGLRGCSHLGWNTSQGLCRAVVKGCSSGSQSGSTNISSGFLWVLNQEASQLDVLDVCFDTPKVHECSLQTN